MSGHGLAVADDGVFFATGECTYNVTNPTFLELGDSAMKVTLVSGKFQIQDWFAPQNRAN